MSSVPASPARARARGASWILMGLLPWLAVACSPGAPRPAERVVRPAPSPEKSVAPAKTPAPSPTTPRADGRAVPVTTLAVGGVTKSPSASHVTTPISADPGALVLAWVVTYVGGGDAPVPTVAGAGLEWEMLATDPAIGTRIGARRLTLFRGAGGGRSTGRLTISGTPTSHWAVVQVGGGEPGGGEPGGGEPGGGEPGGTASVVDVAQVARQGWQTSKTIGFARDPTADLVVGGFLVGRPEVPDPAGGARMLAHHMVASPTATLAVVWAGGAERALRVSWPTPAHSRAIAVLARVAGRG